MRAPRAWWQILLQFAILESTTNTARFSFLLYLLRLAWNPELRKQLWKVPAQSLTETSGTLVSLTARHYLHALPRCQGPYQSIVTWYNCVCCPTTLFVRESTRSLSFECVGLWSAFTAVEHLKERHIAGRAPRSHSWRAVLGRKLGTYVAPLALEGGHHSDRAQSSVKVKDICQLELISPRMQARPQIW